MSLIGKFQSGVQLQTVQHLMKISLCGFYLFAMVHEFPPMAELGLSRLAEAFSLVSAEGD
jgi:hypothetical protein